MRKTDTRGPIRPALLQDFAVAVLLLTRLPLPRLPDHAFDHQARAVWAFPIVGVLVGALAVGTGWTALQVGLPAGAAAGLLLLVQIILTGAMHEDGLADTVDGVWGGHTPERRLEIMKDSAIGTYGVLALILSLGLRWVALTALIPAGFGAVLGAAVLSRAGMPVLMAALPHARESGLSHHVGAPQQGSAALAVLVGLVLTLGFGGVGMILPAFVAGLGIIGLGLIAKAKIGGQTGDILGAAQQIIECSILLTVMTQL